MSKFPIDPGSLDFVRTATSAERDAVIKILMPAAKSDKPVKFPLPWRPARFRKSKQLKSDIGELREAVEAVRHFTARVAASQPSMSGRAGFGTVSVRKGAGTTGTALPGTLGKGTYTGRGTLTAGSKFRVDMHRAKPGAEVGDFYIKGDLSRLRRYLQELSSSQQKMGGLVNMERKDLELRRSRILAPYRTIIGYDLVPPKPGHKGPLTQIPVFKTYKEAEADFRAATEEMQALKDQLELLDLTTLTRLREEGGEFVEAEARVGSHMKRLQDTKGKVSAQVFHRELGKMVWDHCGMARNRAGLEGMLRAIPTLRERFWREVSVPATAGGMNQALEYAGRVADFIDFAEVLATDALTREESCGAHFREEYQTEDGEAKRNDADYSFVSAWGYNGENQAPVLTREALQYEFVKPSVRSYK